MSSELVIGVVAGLIALLASMNLIWWLQEKWEVGPGSPQVRFLGAYSPVLTWLKYRQLPPARRRATVDTSSQDQVPDGDAEVPAPLAEAPDRWAMAILTIGSALLVFIGQLLSSGLPGPERWKSYPFLALGGLAFLVAVRGLMQGQLPRWLSRVVQALGSWLEVAPAQFLLLALSPLLGLAAWLAAGPGGTMRLPGAAVAFWALACALVVAGSWRNEPRRETLPWSRGELLFFALLLAAAFLARGVWLDRIPWLLSGDEGSAGLCAVDFVLGRRNNPFVTGWFSFPTMYSYIESLSIRALGQTIVGARMPSALAGTLAVGGLYLYARAAYGRGVAMASAAFMTTFPLHVHFSRTGLNNVWDSLTAVVLAGALWRAWEGNRRLAFILAGVALGLGQYFYPTARVLLVMLMLWVPIAWLRERRTFGHRLPGLVIMLLVGMVVVLPLALFYMERPNEFSAPYIRVSVLGVWFRNQLEISGATPWQVLWGQLRTSLLAFTSFPLRGYYHGAPMLLPLAAALLVMGACILLLNLRSLQYVWLGLWIVSAVVVGAMSESTPSSQRYLFASPAMAVMVALPIAHGAQWQLRLWPARRHLISLALASIVPIIMAGDVDYYFGRYSANRVFGDLNTETAMQVALYIRGRPETQHVYFFGGRMGYYSHATIPYLVPGVKGQDVAEPLTAPPDWPITGPTIMVFLPERQQDLELVRQVYPDGISVIPKGRDGRILFIAYEISPP